MAQVHVGLGRPPPQPRLVQVRVDIGERRRHQGEDIVGERVDVEALAGQRDVVLVTGGEAEHSKRRLAAAGDDHGGERKVLAALHDLGNAVNMNDCLGEFALSVHHGR